MRYHRIQRLVRANGDFAMTALNLADLGTARFPTPAFNVPHNRAAGASVLFMRALWTWAGLAGGGAVRACPYGLAVGEAIPAAGSAARDWPGRSEGVLGAMAVNTTLATCAGGGPAADQEWTQYAAPAGFSAGGELVPLGDRFCWRISNPTTAFSGGTIVLDELEFYIGIA